MHIPSLYSLRRPNAVHFSAASVALLTGPRDPPGTVGPPEALPCTGTEQVTCGGAGVGVGAGAGLVPKGSCFGPMTLRMTNTLFCACAATGIKVTLARSAMIIVFFTFYLLVDQKEGWISCGGKEVNENLTRYDKSQTQDGLVLVINFCRFRRIVSVSRMEICFLLGKSHITGACVLGPGHKSGELSTDRLWIWTCDTAARVAGVPPTYGVASRAGPNGIVAVPLA